MLGHSRSRHFTKAELFLLQSLAGEVSWAVRELRSKRKHNKVLAAASLELKNSLNMVLGECSLLREIEGSELTAGYDGELTSIENNARETLRTISSYLDAAIAQEERFSAPRENINLVAVIEAALVSCRAKARATGVELEAQYAADLPREYCTDAARFRHVLRNLTDYAVEISDHGRVLLCARKNSDYLEVTLKISEPREESKNESRAMALCGKVYGGDFAYDRLEWIRENLKMFGGHMHFLQRPGEGVEIGVCLA
jgi:signal transduction histidine kinase